MLPNFYRKIFSTKGKLRDEESPLMALQDDDEGSSELLRTILGDKHDAMVKYTKPIFDVYYQFLEKKIAEAPYLLSVLELDYTHPNATALQGPLNQAVDSTDRPAITGPIFEPPSTTWFRLIRHMFQIFRFSIPHLNVDSICKRLQQERIMKADADRNQSAQLILRLIGWTTMFFETPSEYTVGAFYLSGNKPAPPRTMLQEAITWTPHQVNVLEHHGRPIGELIYQAMSDNPFRKPLQTDLRPLKAANISYHTIIYLAGLRIQWVESLAQHLELDRTNGTLKVFRLPSFCLFMCGAKLINNRSVFQNAFDCCFNLDSVNEERKRELRRPLTSQGFLQEILYTYAIIFCQDAYSRRACIKDQTRQEQADFTTKEVHDPFLKALSMAYARGNRPSEYNFGDLKLVYSPDDLPFFAERLAILQDYTLIQAPYNWLTLWRDRREPKEFYAFWSALIFGVATLLLTTVQVLAAIVQIVAQYQSNKS